MVASYTRYWIDTLRLPAVSEEESLRAISVEGYHHVEEALAAGRGAILALPHLGGWEWAGRWLAARGVEVVSVVERLEPPEVLDWFTSLRADLGIVVHPAGPDTVGRLRETLDRNGVVCLLSDRDVTGGGYEVEFCGEVTRLPAGPAVLALRSGAPLLPTAVYQVEGTVTSGSSSTRSTPRGGMASGATPNGSWPIFRRRWRTCSAERLSNGISSSRTGRLIRGGWRAEGRDVLSLQPHGARWCAGTGTRPRRRRCERRGARGPCARSL